jgi:ribonuclease PH
MSSRNEEALLRADGRSADQLRPIRFHTHYTRWAEGSVLCEFGETHVLCNVTVEDKLPGWLRNSQVSQGWLTAEYAMLPRSTQSRTRRERRWPRGRTQEISRLIGRSLRMALDLRQLGERQLIVDCDVLQADGGTRTAAICGGWIAVKMALWPLIEAGEVPPDVLQRQIAAISVGIVNRTPLLDLSYVEDADAEVDLNVIMTAAGEYVEVQGTAERDPFSQSQLDALLSLSIQGIKQITDLQQQALLAE